MKTRRGFYQEYMWLSLLGLLFISVFTPFDAFSQDDRGLKTKLDDTEEAEESLGYATRYALLVGVNRYQEQEIKDLQYAVSDALSIQEILVNKYGFREENIVTLTDQDATREAILSAISSYLEEGVEENSQLLIYFAGHGYTIGSEQSPLGYLLPHDARVENAQDVIATGIAMNDMQRLSESLIPKHVLFLMDACYGGLASTRSSISQVFMRNALERKARQIITAGSASEEVIESGRWKHSAFTKVLLDGLGAEHADANEDGIISTNELFSYIENRVPYYAETEGGKQTPQYSKLTPDDGTFLFISDEEALAALQSDAQAILELDADIIRKQFTTPLEITANVDNARVYVDDKEVGHLSQGIFKHDMSPGYYRIELQKEKYSSTSRDVEIMPDTSLTEPFNMEYIYSEVNFKVTPVDAAVYVGDEYIGSGTFKKELPKGRTQFVVSKEGYRPETLNRNLTLDVIPIEVTLDRIEARLELYTSPGEALVLINGDTLGLTPVRAPLSYGRHTVYIQKDQYRDELLTLDIQESDLVSERIVLREAPETLARREYRAQVASHIRGTLFAGIAASAAYVAYKRFDSALQDATDEDDYREVYEIGKWTSLGIVGLTAIAAASNVIKIGTTRYSRILDKLIEEEARLAIQMVPVYTENQMGLAAVFSF